MFFDSWSQLARVAAVTPIIYFGLILFIRVSGKRSTSQMNNFDWVVTVAMGSMAASGILFVDVAVAEVLMAIALLLGLQWILTRLALEVSAVSRAVKARPKLLADGGELITEALRDERVTPEEVLAAVRESGLSRLDDARWVILETDASFSVIPRNDEPANPTALAGVRGVEVRTGELPSLDQRP